MPLPLHFLSHGTRSSIALLTRSLSLFLSPLSDFISVSHILKSREELAKAEALKNVSSKLSHLEAKAGSLEKELLALRNNEAVGKLEREIMKEKNRYLLLRESYEKKEKLALEKIEVLKEEIGKERANCLRLEEELELEKVRNGRISVVDSWKTKYSSLEAWILRLLENNPGLIDKHDMDFFRINKTAGELLKSNAISNKKNTFFVAKAKSETVIDISDNDIEFVRDSFEDKSSEMKYSSNSGDKNYSKRKFQVGQTSSRGVLELDDEDVVCINELMAKKFAKGIK